jgi:hypothetical protein
MRHEQSVRKSGGARATARSVVSLSVASLLVLASGAASGNEVAATLPHAPRSASPYRVELIDESGWPLATYAHRGRYYVLGMPGRRYTIRVNNPTGRRVEAVVSVDGLDVIDGQAGDFARKRGYIVPPYGELRVDGFRVSTEQVAAFRFSSVAGSYAGRKGVARNVGVIGVAIFEERQNVSILPEPYPLPPVELGGRGPHPRSEAPGRSAPRSAGKAPSAADAPSASGAPAPSASREALAEEDSACCAPPSTRPGLGTEFGEYRSSNVSWTRFERRNPGRPDAVAELRYNDRSGLMALGIQLEPRIEHDEVLTRETATPFPMNPGFATPPPGY